MSLLPILQYPDPKLRTVAQPVTQFDAALEQLAADMLETMYDSNGVGLAATQVDVHQRILVMDTSEGRDQPIIVVNPQIVWRSEEKAVGEEGCLSIPGIYDSVERHAAVKVEAVDAKGQALTIDAHGLQAVCLQHEIDHLDGKLFIDYLSALKRNRIKAKMSKRARAA
ncbi:peptide deformylase [Lampropedia cohaerens]|uniref:Peptide deformylase n=1 Tax=Lampropedia cohaerens TaxID=1610491 RepID=A0A0U1PWQ4_9BURK|nr:peptide deformylase [Lampropedia cohaerens]KKW66964.1 peptide deformylase [Lampropedia cohaerens]